jgi:hypothetical protein
MRAPHEKDKSLPAAEIAKRCYVGMSYVGKTAVSASGPEKTESEGVLDGWIPIIQMRIISLTDPVLLTEKKP